MKLGVRFGLRHFERPKRSRSSLAVKLLTVDGPPCANSWARRKGTATGSKSGIAHKL